MIEGCANDEGLSGEWLRIVRKCEGRLWGENVRFWGCNSVESGFGG